MPAVTPETLTWSDLHDAAVGTDADLASLARNVFRSTLAKDSAAVAEALQRLCDAINARKESK